MRYLAVLVVLIGCYEAPDYSGTRFKCDDEHACPDGQLCINGFCGGSTSGQDGAIDSPPSDLGVACGEMTCGANEKCCANILGTPSCIALSATCAGITATCDGTEDCAGTPCCETGGGTITCVTTCSGQHVCRDNADCTDPTQPACCMIPGTGEPWGRCFAACP